MSWESERNVANSEIQKVRSFEPSQGRGNLSLPIRARVYLECQANALFFHSITVLGRGTTMGCWFLSARLFSARSCLVAMMLLREGSSGHNGGWSGRKRGWEELGRTPVHVLFLSHSLGTDILRAKRITLTFPVTAS